MWLQRGIRETIPMAIFFVKVNIQIFVDLYRTEDDGPRLNQNLLKSFIM